MQENYILFLNFLHLRNYTPRHCPNERCKKILDELTNRGSGRPSPPDADETKKYMARNHCKSQQISLLSFVTFVNIIESELVSEYSLHMVEFFI